MYFWTDEKTFTQRLNPFRTLYHNIYGREYGVERREQFDVWSFPDLGVCFVGLNSCDRVDHLRFKGAIYEEALFAANERLREALAEFAPCVKIVVWHHDLNWLGQSGHEDCLDPAILGHLVDAGYDLALCGHTHRANFNVYEYPGFRLPIVAAGSLCAGARQREESIPRLYNLIHIQGNTARVHTRQRETKQTPWRPYVRWGAPPVAYFDVPLVKSLHQRPLFQDDLPTPRAVIPRQYYAKLVREFEYLDIAGIDNERAIPLKLSQVYVKLRVIPGEDEETDEDFIEESGSFDIHTALQRYRQLVIVGDPGSGKSTFLKFIALMISRARVENNLALAENELNLRAPLPTPIFVSLWDLADHVRQVQQADDDLLLHYVVEQFASLGVELEPASVRAMLASGECCLLFDGLDEVPTEGMRERISRLVEAFVSDYPDNRYVITSRVRGYTGGAILRGAFQRCDIQDFDADDIRHFARNWLCALLNVPPAAVDDADAPVHQEYNALVNAVFVPRVRLLAINPLLMTVIAIVHWNRKTLPQRRVELYDQCINVLLGQRKEAEWNKVARWQELADRVADKERKYERAWTRKRFAEIALSIMLQEQEEEITKQQVIETLTEPFERRYVCTRDKAQIEAEIFLDHQELRSGLLVSRRSRSYRFVHLTFQEYLAAWGLAGRNDYWEMVQPHLRQQKWFETLQLLGGEFAQSSDEKLCEYLDLLLANMGESITSRAPVVALCANIDRDTQEVADLRAGTREIYEAALRDTLDAFDPRAKVSETTQLEVLEALAGLGSAVKQQLIAATRSQKRSVRSRALELLCPYLPDDDIFAMTPIFNDRSKETIKTYLRALLERDEVRTEKLLGSIEPPGYKLVDAVAELELLHFLPSFDTVLSWFQALDSRASTLRVYFAELVQRDEAKVKIILQDSQYWTEPLLNTILNISRLDLFDDDSLFSIAPLVGSDTFRAYDYRSSDSSETLVITYVKTIIKRDESRFKSALQDNSYWTKSILKAIVALARTDLFDNDSLFSMISSISAVLKSYYGYMRADRDLATIYAKAAIERDESRLKLLLQDSDNWTVLILGAIASLSRIDWFDDDSLFSVILELPTSTYVQAAIERDEDRFRSLMRDSENWTMPILKAVGELARFDLFDDDCLFSIVLEKPMLASVQAAIERDEDRFRSLMRDSENWTEPILNAVGGLARFDLFDNDSLLSVTSIALGFARHRQFFGDQLVILPQEDIWDTTSMLLAESYRRDPRKTWPLLQTEQVIIEKLNEDTLLGINTEYLVDMLMSESSVLKSRWLLAALLANCLDLLDKFSDESIVQVCSEQAWQWLWSTYGNNVRTQCFHNPQVRQRFIKIAQRLVELGDGNPYIKNWLQWALEQDQ